MIYFQAENIGKSYTDKVLFDGLSFSVRQGDRIALVARNGTGKTTLMKIIAGQESPDNGACTYKNDLRVSLLRQDPVFEPGVTVLEALLRSDNELTSLVHEYLSLMMHERDDPDNQNSRLGQILERMDNNRAWDFEQRIRQIISKLNVGGFQDKVDHLSGGQQKRLELARVMLEEADLLLLDEPTNHLDLDMIEWMEGTMSRKKTTLLIVSHDRYFLDAVCNRIMEIDQGRLYVHTGNYTYYLQKKQERLESIKAGSEKAANLLRKEAEWMRRSPMARTTKSKARIGAFYDLQERAAVQRETGMDGINMHMSRLGKKVLELEHITKEFDGVSYIKDFSYVFKRGDRIGIAGPNGSGKSTLLNIITGQLAPGKGKVTTGETIQFGYYRQEGLKADETKRVLDVITDIAEHFEQAGNRSLSASQVLYQFNFSHAAQYDWVHKLSGGEKRRLYLLTVLMNNPNFLILDEPTNDFDIETLNILEDFLSDYTGCLLIVSHDRYFLDNLVDQLFVFEGDGNVRGFVGNYSAYRESRKQVYEKTPGTGSSAAPTATPKKSLPATKDRLTYKEQKEFETLEKEIEVLELEKESLLAMMNQAGMSPAHLLTVSEKYSAVSSELEEKSDRWLELSERT